MKHIFLIICLIFVVCIVVISTRTGGCLTKCEQEEFGWGWRRPYGTPFRRRWWGRPIVNNYPFFSFVRDHSESKFEKCMDFIGDEKKCNEILYE